jgi:hypothetical protein
MKVFCGNCKYKILWMLCKKQKKVYEDWEKKSSYYEMCAFFNENNDCINYKRKFWKFWIKEK